MPEVLLEYTRVDKQIKVTACDPVTGVEAVVIVPSNTRKKDMNDLAIRKLQYLLGKNPKQ